MDGLICDPRNIAGSWLVSFDQYGALPEIACISVKEADLEILPPSEFTVDNNTKILEAWKNREEDLAD